MLEAYKVMLCHVDERESTNRATGSFVKNAVFEIANLPGDIWLHQCMALLKVHSLHLWRDKSKDCFKCFDAIYPMGGCPTDSGL
jgi:hypothetical protein